MQCRTCIILRKVVRLCGCREPCFSVEGARVQLFEGVIIWPLDSGPQA